jgi:DNA (cytosine-5)-methyltransferase 1
MNYYNEFDNKTANWLKELIKQGLIPNGDVDTRSITEIKPHELNGYTQCHFFAGIGGWSLALQLANWDSTRHVWTGSTPCQPFSTAGKQLGDKDERHLWPVFFNLIKECRPKYVFGEQVASAIGKGWLDGISTDLGEEGYTCGSAVLGAHSVGAPHIRQRLYWVAYSGSQGLEGHRQSGKQSIQEGRNGEERHTWTSSSSDESCGMAQPSDNGAGGDPREAGGCGGESVDARTESLRQAYGEAGSSWADSRSASSASGVVNAECSGLMGSPISNRESAEARREEEPNDNRVSSEGCAIASGMGNPIMSRCETCDSISGGDESRPEQSQDSSAWSNVGVADTELCGCECQPQQRSSSILPPMDEERESREPACPHSPSPHRPARPDDHWSNCTTIPCRDGKARRIPAQAIIEPVLQHVLDGFSCSLDARRNILSAAQGFPLTETIPARVILLKGAGNAIVSQVAAEFIAASIEAIAT